MDNFGKIARSLAQWVSVLSDPPLVFAEAEINLPIRTPARPLVEFLFVIEGSMRFAVGGLTTKLAAGDLALVNAHFGNHDIPTDRPRRYSCISFEIAKCPALRALRKAPLLEARPIADCDALRRLYREVCERQQACSGHLPELQLKAALLRLLVAIVAEGDIAEIPSGCGASHRLLEAIAMIRHSHAHPDLSLDDLARTAHLSKDHFGRLFKNEFKLSPMRYLLQLRLRRARNLLLKSELSIKQIAQTVGFNDPLYFSRAFQRIMKTSPTAVRSAGITPVRHKR